MSRLRPDQSSVGGTTLSTRPVGRRRAGSAFVTAGSPTPQSSRGFSVMLLQDEEDRLLLIPGPTPVHRRVLNALALPTISHGSQMFSDIFVEALDMLRSVMGLSSGRVFVFSGSGTLAQEAAIVN